MSNREQRIIAPLEASHPGLGRWLWAMEDTRARTKVAVAGLDQNALDWAGPGVANAIGSLLYHIALIEADYLYSDILGLDYPDWLEEAFPFPDRNPGGRLSIVTEVPLDEHLTRLDRVRHEFLRLVSPLTPEQLQTPRLLPEPGYEISPDWTLHHLMQHEAEHRGEINALRALQAS